MTRGKEAMRIENSSRQSMMSYSAEGATEKANPQLSIAYVVGHELGHASTNRMLAISKGEEVDQNITYKVTVRDGRLMAVGGTTEATFKKADVKSRKPETVSKSQEPGVQRPAKNITLSPPDTAVIYGRHIQSLKVKREELEQRLMDMKNGENAEGVTGSESESGVQEAGMPLPQDLSLKDYINDSEQERMKREIKRLEQDIKEVKTKDEDRKDGNSQLIGLGHKSQEEAIDQRPQTTAQNTTLNGLVFLNSFRFVEQEVPPVVFIDGGGSAIKVRDALDKLIAEKDRREPPAMQRLNLDPAFYKVKSSRWSSLGGYLTDLYASNAPLLSAEGFNINTALSSDENVLTASASSNGVPDTYKVKVDRLANAHQVESDTFEDTGSELNLSGAININDFDVLIEETDSLYTIADKINYGEDVNRNRTLDFGTEIDADNDRLMDSGEDGNRNGVLDTREDINFNNKLDGGADKHSVTAAIAGGKLILTASDTGKAINLKDDNEILKELGILSYNIYPLNVTFRHELQAAQKAKITVDGVEYEREGNEISDVIQGVALSLRGASSTEATVTISESMDAAFSNINAFVNDYNDAMKFLNEQISFTKVFYQDVAAQRIRTDLMHSITDNVSGQPSDFDNITDLSIAVRNSDKNSMNQFSLLNLLNGIREEFKNSLSMPLKGSGSMLSSIEDLGIRTKEDDNLEIDGEKLASALLTNNTDVSNMFNSGSGISSRLKKQLDMELDERLGAIIFQKAVIGDTVENLDFFQKFQEFRAALNIINEKGRLISSNLSVVA
ncbi:MAG: flagellar filament capping protein FliD [Nitrospirae bacterium]|nr:flagellar filament capping protein FliD [Nitrospirota bacterium]